MISCSPEQNSHVPGNVRASRNSLLDAGSKELLAVPRVARVHGRDVGGRERVDENAHTHAALGQPNEGAGSLVGRYEVGRHEVEIARRVADGLT